MGFIIKPIHRIRIYLQADRSISHFSSICSATALPFALHSFQFGILLDAQWKCNFNFEMYWQQNTRIRTIGIRHTSAINGSETKGQKGRRRVDYMHYLVDFSIGIGTRPEPKSRKFPKIPENSARLRPLVSTVSYCGHGVPYKQ